MSRNDAGISLMETMFTAGVLVVGLVMLMGSAVNVAAQSQVSEIRAQALQFNMSLLESMRGRTLKGIMLFNSDGSELNLDDDGNVSLHGVGPAELTIECVIQPGAAEPSAKFLQLPTTEENFINRDLTNVPNPLEVRVMLKVDRGMGGGHEYKFQSSSLISW